jgi:hypothetical protein
MSALNLKLISERETFFMHFAMTLGECRGLISRILENEDLLVESECRDVGKKELNELKSSIDAVSQMFYNVAKPA